MRWRRFTQCLIGTYIDLLTRTYCNIFFRKPVGKFHLQVCTTTPCQLRGSDRILETIKQHLQTEVSQTTPDGVFTVDVVECAGACVNAPMMTVNQDYYVSNV